MRRDKNAKGLSMAFRFQSSDIGEAMEMYYRFRACLVWAGFSDEKHRRNMFELSDIGCEQKRTMCEFIDSSDMEHFDAAKPEVRFYGAGSSK